MIIPATSDHRADPSTVSPRQSMLGKLIDLTIPGSRSLRNISMPTDKAVNGMARARVHSKLLNAPFPMVDSLFYFVRDVQLHVTTLSYKES